LDGWYAEPVESPSFGSGITESMRTSVRIKVSGWQADSKREVGRDCHLNDEQECGAFSQCEYEDENDDERNWFEAQLKLEGEIDRRWCKTTKQRRNKKERSANSQLRLDRKLNQKRRTEQRQKLRALKDHRCSEWRQEEDFFSEEWLDEDDQVCYLD